MSSPSLVKLDPRTPENRLPVVPQSSINQRWIIRFRSNFVQSLHTWHPKCCESSTSRGQRSKSQRDKTCAKICKIINNSARHCSISLKFCTDFDHVTLDAPQTFKCDTAWHNVSASKNAIIQAWISCCRWNLVKIIPEQSTTRNGQTPKSQWLRRGLLDCIQIWYRVLSRHRRCTANVQGQRSRSQCIIQQWIGSAMSNLAWRRN